MKKISIIVAVAKNMAIGKNNDLLWHIAEDMQWFKKQTSGHTVIMGKKTWESLPVKPLPKRTNIVLTDDPDDYFEGCRMAASISSAIELMDDHGENFIIGGGSVYRQFLPMAQKLYLTEVHKDFEADIFFSAIDNSKWTEVFRDDHPDTELPYSFVILERRQEKV